MLIVRVWVDTIKDDFKQKWKDCCVLEEESERGGGVRKEKKKMGNKKIFCKVILELF